MNTPYPHIPENKLVYIRRVDPARLPEDLRAQVPADAAVWGVHAPDGACLALTGDRRLAFSMARQNDLSPVSAH